MLHSLLLTELEVAIESGSQEGRLATLRRVTSLFLGQSHRFSEPQIEVFDDVLVHLIRKTDERPLSNWRGASASRRRLRREPFGNWPTMTTCRLPEPVSELVEAAYPKAIRSHR